MPFKFYKNKITCHASLSVRKKDKNKWYNMPVSHVKPKDSFIEIQDPHPMAKQGQKSYIRKYVRRDKRKVKGHPYREYCLSKDSEDKIKEYLKTKYKKR